MGRKLVPVIATDAQTGEVSRYPSYKAASEALGIRANLIARACLNDRPIKGFAFRREDDWVLPGRGGK